MEQQEAQKQTVSVVEFNDVKNEVRNLTQLISMMMRKCRRENCPKDNPLSDRLVFWENIEF